MSKIWKYPLTLAPLQTVRLPGQTRVLSVGEQHGKLVMWAEVNPDNPLYDYTVAVIATGDDGPPEGSDVYWSFIDTITIPGIGWVSHVFVRTELNSADETAA